MIQTHMCTLKFQLMLTFFKKIPWQSYRKVDLCWFFQHATDPLPGGMKVFFLRSTNILKTNGVQFGITFIVAQTFTIMVSSIENHRLQKDAYNTLAKTRFGAKALRKMLAILTLQHSRIFLYNWSIYFINLLVHLILNVLWMLKILIILFTWRMISHIRSRWTANITNCLMKIFSHSKHSKKVIIYSSVCLDLDFPFKCVRTKLPLECSLFWIWYAFVYLPR